MNNRYKTVAVRRSARFDAAGYVEFLQNPLWYVTVVTCLAGFTIYLKFWWWLTAGVALSWGLWLVWQNFGNRGHQHLFDDEDAQLQSWLVQAITYQTKIKQALKHTESHNLLYGSSLTSQLDAWIEVIQALAERLTRLRHDDLIFREVAAVPRIIEALELQLAQTPEANISAQLEQILVQRRKQLAELNHFQNTIKQTEIQIENTLSLLSTVYTQILTGQSVTHLAASHRFLAEVDDEVNRLQDRLDALCEVKGWG